MPSLIDPKGNPVDIDDPEEASKAFLEGKYQLPHADAVVPMTDPDGKVVGIKASDAYQMLQAGGRFATSEEHKQAYLDEKYGSLGQTARTAIESGLSGLTLGGTDIAARLASPSLAREMKERQEAHPVVAGVSKVVGGLVPIVASGGAAAPEEATVLGAEGAEAAAGAAKGAEALEGVSGAAKTAETVPAATQEASTVGTQAAQAPSIGQVPVANPADVAAFDAAKASVDNPVAQQVAASTAAARNPARAAFQAVAQIAPPTVVSKVGEAVSEGIDGLLTRMVGPSTGTAGDIARRVVKMAASGAVEGGIYAAADQLDEQALGDPELNAEKIIAAFGHGALFGSILGGGLAGTAEVGKSLLGRVAPKLQGVTDELALRSLEVGGGRRAGLIRQAEEKFDGGAKGAARFVNEEGLIVSGDTIAQRADRISKAAKLHGETLDGVVRGAEDLGAESVSTQKIMDELRSSRAVHQLALTADLNPSLLGIHPEESGLSGGQANFLHAISRTGRHIPEVSGAEAADLVSRGLVAETLLPTKLSRVALSAEVNDAEHGILKEIQREGYNKVIKKFPETTDLLSTLKERKLLTTQGRLTSAGEFAIRPQGRLSGRERELLNELSTGRVVGDEAEMAALRSKGFTKTGYKITENGRLVSGMTKRGLIDKINDMLLRSADQDGKISLSNARTLRKQVSKLSNWDVREPRPLSELKLYRAVDRIMESHIERSIKSVDRDMPGLYARYKQSKDAYAKLNWAAEMATKSAAAKLSNNRLGLVAKLAATTELLSGHPLAAAGAVAAKFASEYAPGTAAAVLQKLSRLRTVESAVRKVDDDINSSAKGWYDRMTGGGGKKKAAKTVARGVTRSLRDEKSEATTEPSESAHATIQRLHAISASGPIDENKASSALGGLGTHAPKTTGQVASKLNASLQYMASIVPKEHTDYSDITQPRSGRLSSVDYHQFAQQAKAVEEPLQVFRDFAAGKVSRAAMETAKTNSPKLYEQFQSAVLREMSKDPTRTSSMSYQGQLQLGMALGVPTHWSQQPAGLRFLQADQSTVAKPPNSSPIGNRMSKAVHMKDDLGSQLATSVEKISLQSTPGQRGRR